jgi:hypothetical protein
VATVALHTFSLEDHPVTPRRERREMRGKRQHRTLPCVGAAAVVSAALVTHLIAAAQTSTRFDALAAFSPEKRVEIEAGSPVVEVLHERGDDFAVAGGVMTTATPERLVAWSREIAELQRGRYVPLIQRFSSPPRIEDLASLTLDEEDLDDLENCRPGRCGLKLSAFEIQQVNRAITSSPRRWRGAALEAFRSIMLDRVRSFQRNGFGSAPAYDDKERPLRPALEFEAVLGRFAQDSLFTPRVARFLRAFPASGGDGESFFYWSKDLLGDAKPIVSITHLSILPASGYEPTIVVASQVFATHYLNASLSLTAVTDCAGDGRRHVVYLRRSRVDVFQGAFGSLVRRVVNKRVRAEGRPVLESFRMKLERGLPLLSRPTPFR